MTINLTDTLEDGKTETGQFPISKKSPKNQPYAKKNLTLSNCYPNYTETYSDGSNKQNWICSHFKKIQIIKKKKHLVKEASVFNAGLNAINLALNIISENNSNPYIITVD